jgi:hypothetical protein
MAHNAKMRVKNQIPVGNVDLEIEVERNGEKLGELHISKGGVDWIPRHSRSRFVLNWSEVDSALQEKGKSKPKSS